MEVDRIYTIGCEVGVCKDEVSCLSKRLAILISILQDGVVHNLWSSGKIHIDGIKDKCILILPCRFSQRHILQIDFVIVLKTSAITKEGINHIEECINIVVDM